MSPLQDKCVNASFEVEAIAQVTVPGSEPRGSDFQAMSTLHYRLVIGNSLGGGWSGEEGSAGTLDREGRSLKT